MMSLRFWIFLFFCAVSLLPAGCYVGPVIEKDLADCAGLRRIKDGDFYKIDLQTDKETGESILSITNVARQMDFAGSTRVQYSWFYDKLGLIAVPGRLPDGNEYSVFIDTGSPSAVLLSGRMVRANDLAIFPLGTDSRGEGVGLCDLPELRIGEARMIHPNCAYLGMHWEVKLLCLPWWRQKALLLGLRQLREFSYVMFDNANQELELGCDGRFCPENVEEWIPYRLSYEGNSLQLKLMVELPLEGEVTNIMFDSCGRYGMVVGDEFWEKLSRANGGAAAKKGTVPMGFMGWLPCRKARIAELEVGDIKVKEAEVIIFGQDSPMWHEPGYVSMKFFGDRTVVLDFERMVMWVRKQADEGERSLDVI